MASMAGLRGLSQALLEGSLQLSGSSRLAVPGGNRVAAARPGLAVRAQQQAMAEGDSSAHSNRRAVLRIVATGLAGGSFVKAMLADAKSIKVGPPPPPSGGLPGTLNADQPRDLQLPLKQRFYLQPLPPSEAAARAKESAKDILNVKQLIDKKEWPYVMNDLRLKAGYLRFDLNTIISAKPKEEKKALKELTGKLFAAIDEILVPWLTQPAFAAVCIFGQLETPSKSILPPAAIFPVLGISLSPSPPPTDLDHHFLQVAYIYITFSCTN